MNDVTDTITKGRRQNPADKDMVRLWLKLLACSGTIERHLRQRFRNEFAVTLPQFDVMSALDRAGRPQSMSELSNHLVVSNGNVTGVVDRLVRDGLVRRRNSDGDRRVQLISLTDAGIRLFTEMAKRHRRWVSELLGDLKPREVTALAALLQRMRHSINGNL